MVLIGLAGQAIHRQRAFYILWAASLALALTGLGVVDVYRQSLSDLVIAQGRQMLTADVTISARRPLTEGEIEAFDQTLPAGARTSQLIEMTAMVSTDAQSRLALVRAIDDGYPLLGRLEIEGDEVHGEELGGAPRIWVADDLLTLLEVGVGDDVQIGGLSAKIAGRITRDSSQTLRFGGLAPRLYIHKKYLSDTRLLRFGSTFSETRLGLTGGASVKSRLERALGDPGLQISEPRDLERGALGVLGRVLDYLGLVGLVTLVLGWIGVYFLAKRWLAREETDTALLKCVGLSARELGRLLRLKLAAVLGFGTALAGALAFTGARAILPLVADNLPEEFRLHWSWATTALLVTIGPLAGLLLLEAPLTALARSRPSAVLRGATNQAIRWRPLLGLGALVALIFVGLTFLESRSFRVSAGFLLGLGGSAALVAALSYFCLRALGRLRARRGWRGHLVVANWTRNAGPAVLLVTVSALASLLAQLVPHLERTLVGDLTAPGAAARPALFLYDIQDEQLAPLAATLKQLRVPVSQTSAFVRARLLTVNGAGFERSGPGAGVPTREDEADARFRNRGINLTYRPALSAAETFEGGKAFGDLAADEVSIEREYAKRVGLKLGDHLTFDVQGAEIPAVIAQVRGVNWDSFQPNFFVEFRETADTPLLAAPKTWLMTLNRSERKPSEVQRHLSRRFSNVSSLNVQETLDHLLALIAQLGRGLEIASALTLGLGTLVFLIVVLFQMASARDDWRQLGEQGLSARQIWQVQALNYVGLATFGTILGSLCALGVTFGLARGVFDVSVHFDAPAALLTTSLTLFATLASLSAYSAYQLRHEFGRH